MAETNFKVGDKVKALTNQGCDRVIVGKTYTVTKVKVSGGFYENQLVIVEGGLSQFGSRWELVENEPKVGDRVKIVKYGGSTEPSVVVGKEGTITAYGETCPYVVQLDGRPWTTLCFDYEIELITTNTKENNIVATKFKKGDRVQVKKAPSNAYRLVGKIGRVVDTDDGYVGVSVPDLISRYPFNEAELENLENLEVKKGFQVGDEVVIARNPNIRDDQNWVGLRAEVDEVGYRGDNKIHVVPKDERPDGFGRRGFFWDLDKLVAADEYTGPEYVSPAEQKRRDEEAKVKAEAAEKEKAKKLALDKLNTRLTLLKSDIGPDFRDYKCALFHAKDIVSALETLSQ